MTSIDFNSIAKTLPAGWRSVIVGKVGAANIKVLRMDERPYGEETHDYNEGLLVLDGQLLLAMPGMADKRFDRSVIYMCAHSKEGAMGIILNRPARTCSGNFFIDDEVLAAEGVTDFTPYAVSPGETLMPDFFVPAPGARTVVGRS